MLVLCSDGVKACVGCTEVQPGQELVSVVGLKPALACQALFEPLLCSSGSSYYTVFMLEPCKMSWQGIALKPGQG